MADQDKKSEKKYSHSLFQSRKDTLQEHGDQNLLFCKDFALSCWYLSI